MTMKHNWEYKTLGSACIPKKEILRASLKFGKEDTIEYIDISSIHKDSGTVNPTTYTFMDAPSRAQQVVNDNDVLVSLVRPNLKNIALIQDDKDNLVASSGFCVLRGKTLSQRYIYHLVNSKYFTNKLVIKCAGAAYPAVREQDVKDTIVPVPPMEVQKQIVEELDKINEVIENCRELLRNLDALSQSLFYDFFGDPVTNPKGFELKKLGEIDEISSAKRVLVQDVVDNGIPFIRGTELACLSKQNSFDPSVFTMFITPEHYERVKSITGVPKPHDLLIPSINADGYIWEINTTEPLYFKDGRVLWVHVNHGVHSSKWLKFALSNIIKEKYANLSRGAVFAELTLVFLRNLDIIVPPLSLQEKFATRVEQIEAEKKTVEETIANLQMLLDSRMDYWFN